MTWCGQSDSESWGPNKAKYNTSHEFHYSIWIHAFSGCPDKIRIYEYILLQLHLNNIMDLFVWSLRVILFIFAYFVMECDGIGGVWIQCHKYLEAIILCREGSRLFVGRPEFLGGPWGGSDEHTHRELAVLSFTSLCETMNCNVCSKGVKNIVASQRGGVSNKLPVL